MSYKISCDCGHHDKAANIVDLISGHTDEAGRLLCSSCGNAGAWIMRSSKLQEDGHRWVRYIKAVLPIETEYDTYTPYVFLTARTAEEAPHGVHFNYFKDTRPQGGRLKHGHGPGGAPVLNASQLGKLIRKLVLAGFFTPDELADLADELRRKKLAG